jgi:polyketide cyclase/dehydrase/lipid transport protein
MMTPRELRFSARRFVELATVAAGLTALSAFASGQGIAADIRLDTFRVTRSAAIQAPPEKIQAQLSDFHGWRAWSPWERMDAGMKRSFGGAPSGKGATYAWEGNADVGQGRMEITESQPDKVALELDLVKPFEAHYKLEFSLVPKGGTTEVTWSMVGSMQSVPKVVQLFVDMERTVGPKFESGLANLKSLTETDGGLR